MSESIKSLYVTTGNVLVLHNEYDSVIDTNVYCCYRVNNIIYYTKYNIDNKNYDVYRYNLIANKKELVISNVLDVLSHYDDRLFVVDYANRVVEISSDGLNNRIIFSSASHCWYVNGDIYLIGIGRYLKCLDLYHRLLWEIYLPGDIWCIYKQDKIIFVLVFAEGRHLLILIDYDRKEEMLSIDISNYINTKDKFVKQSFFVFDKYNIGLFLGNGAIIYQIQNNKYNFYPHVRSVVNINDININDKTEDINILSASTSKLPRINIAVTCHEKYLKYLNRCLESIDRQDIFYHKYLVLDGCSLPIDVSAVGWIIIQGNWGSPNPGRNLALKLSKDADWIIFFDADNVMADGYMKHISNKVLSSDDRVAIIYPDVYFVDYYTDNVRHKFVHRNLDRWENSRKNRIDMSSVWRVKALQMVGGLVEDMPTEDDYHIADKLLKAGWLAIPMETYTIHYERDNELGRWKEAFNSGKEYEAMWRIRDITVVTLFSGREELLLEWEKMIRKIYWPQNSYLFIVDNSVNEGFHSNIMSVLQNIEQDKIFSSITIKTVDDKYKQSISSDDSYFEWEKHLHIAKLYSNVFPVIETDFILTIEDDVIVENENIVRYFYDIFTDDYCRDGRIGAIGCAYADPIDDSYVTAALDVNDWGKSRIKWSDIASNIMDVKLIGGGFTMWANWAVKPCLPICANLYFDSNFSNIRIEGWDYSLSKNIINNGYRILLYSLIKAKHLPRKWKESKI